MSVAATPTSTIQSLTKPSIGRLSSMSTNTSDECGSLCGEYSTGLSYLDRKARQKQNSLSLVNQRKHITHRMLMKMYDWLSTVCWSYKIDQQGLFLCIELINHYTTIQTIDKSRLQALGMVCLLISCKYTGQTKKFKISEISQMCKSIYQEDQLIQLEASVLESVDYDLELPHTYRYFSLFVENHASSIIKQQEQKICFWLEIQLLLHENTQQLTSEQIFLQILNFVLERDNISSDKYSLILHLKTIAQTTNYKTICHKYMQLFDTEQYLKQLSKNKQTID